MFPDCVLMTMSSIFTIPLIIPHIFACTKVFGEFSTTITGCAWFIGVTEAWFIDSVGNSVRCRGDRLEHCFKYIYDGFLCDSTDFKCTT